MSNLNIRIAAIKRADAIRRYTLAWYFAKAVPGTAMTEFMCGGIKALEREHTLSTHELRTARQQANKMLELLQKH